MFVDSISVDACRNLQNVRREVFLTPAPKHDSTMVPVSPWSSRTWNATPKKSLMCLSICTAEGLNFESRTRAGLISSAKLRK